MKSNHCIELVSYKNATFTANKIRNYIHFLKKINVVIKELTLLGRTIVSSIQLVGISQRIHFGYCVIILHHNPEGKTTGHIDYHSCYRRDKLAGINSLHSRSNDNPLGILITMVEVNIRQKWCLDEKWKWWRSCHQGAFKNGIVIIISALGPLLLTCFNFNPSMDK